MKRLFIVSIAALAFTACEKKAAEGGDKAGANAAAKAVKPAEKASEAPAVEKAEAKPVVEKAEAKPAVEKAEAKPAVEKAEAKPGGTAEAGQPEKAEQPTKVAAADGTAGGDNGCVYGDAVKAQEVKDGAKPEAAAAACGGAAGCGGCGGATDVKPVTAEGTLYGSPFTLTDTDTVELTKVMASADDFNGKNVRVSANVNKVCKKKGCWFVLQGQEGDEQFVRVTMNHKFFVPLDCEGKKAVVEGVFRKVELPEPARKHLAEDGGEDPKKVTGKAVEMTLIASSVQLRD